MREAARVLVEARVHGAPVIDAEGRLVGIVSLLDLVDGEPDSREGTEIPVAARMTPAVITIDAAATVYEAAARMVHASVHRLVVLDEAKRPIGIVTPTDVLRAAVNLQEGFRLRPTPAGEPDASDGRGP